MELITRHPSSAPALVLGYLFLTAATLLFALLVYISVIGFEEPIPGASHGPFFFIRHVVLVPGFFPWPITATWVAPAFWWPCSQRPRIYWGFHSDSLCGFCYFGP